MSKDDQIDISCVNGEETASHHSCAAGSRRTFACSIVEGINEELGPQSPSHIVELEMDEGPGKKTHS